MAKTKFFQSCLGVFQGGGCRAAALVGAYDEAIKRGVHFTEVAGTSAGSILAALIGAGAEPNRLAEFIKDLDFRRFLKPPEPISDLGFFAKRIAPSVTKYANILCFQGLYSSSEIEKWIEACLTDILGKHQGPIPFSMLPFPTSVVATDIVSRCAKIWNQRLTPDDSVARAVRASCSIPIFFQPVSQQFVDGGALSNLPAFVFSNGAAERPLASRVLAFALQGDPEELDPWGTLPFFKAVVNTVVEGSQHLQMELQPDVHTIPIPTGSVKATDFDKIDETTIETLIKQGRDASSAFFDAELLNLKAPPMPSYVCYDREELYSRLSGHLNNTVRDVLISERDTEFVYDIFPTLALWKMRGATIRVLLPLDEPKSQIGKYRRRLLSRLGVSVVERESIPFRGYFINGSDSAEGAAYIEMDSDGSQGKIEAIIYEGRFHSSARSAMHEQLAALFPSFSDPVTLSFVKDSEDTLLSRLSTVSQYSKAGVELSLESISLSTLVALASYVHEYKYRQFEHWIPELSNRGIDLFSPAAVQIGESIKSIITPPVVEETGGKYVLIEGSTRATYLRDRGDSQMHCVVVRGVQDALPGRQARFEHIRVLGRHVATESRYRDFDYSLFRKIESAARPLSSII